MPPVTNGIKHVHVHLLTLIVFPLPYARRRREVAERKAAKNKEYNMEEDHDRRDERKVAHLLPPRHDRCVGASPPLCMCCVCHEWMALTIQCSTCHYLLNNLPPASTP